MTVERIGVSLQGTLLDDFDRLVRSEGFPSRSEALRELIRRALIRERRETGGKVVGTITFLYRHDVGMVTHRILHRQHDFLGSIRATAHTHLNEETCLEVLIVEGSAERVEELADRLKDDEGRLVRGNRRRSAGPRLAGRPAVRQSCETFIVRWVMNG